MVWTLLLALLAPAHAGKKDAPTDGEAAAWLIGRALTEDVAWERLRDLTDSVGARPPGPRLDAAIAWAKTKLEGDGLANVRVQPVEVDQFVVHTQRVELVGSSHRIRALALGNSPSTPEDGIEAPLVVVDDFDHLERLGSAVAGHIVLFDVPWTDYSAGATYRAKAPGLAGAHGALAVLVRSAGPAGNHEPHTGYSSQSVGKTVPSAALPAEDSALLRRLAEAGETRVRVTLRTEKNRVPSGNVLAEVPGREHPEEIVVLGCHLDSWPVGTGAQDDAAGCVMVMEAARLIGTLPKPPRRTVRVVLYAGEELGLDGAQHYAATLGAAEKHVAGVESDTGAGLPSGFSYNPGSADPAAVERGVAPALHLLAGLNATEITRGWGGTDLEALSEQGMVSLAVARDLDGYWPIHHTEADTLDKIDPIALRYNVAVTAVMGWWLAEHGPL